ncbi:MAG: polyvinylalcohol dehydrogenase [Myxococcaceae bacterium]|nr:polyvinylalcohol dehydrogenase [Myxococcaceae bacterium]
MFPRYKKTLALHPADVTVQCVLMLLSMVAGCPDSTSSKHPSSNLSPDASNTGLGRDAGPRTPADGSTFDAYVVTLDGATDAAAIVDAGATKSGDWIQASFDVRGSVHNAAEHTLSPENVSRLTLLWRFDDQAAGHAIGPVHASPVVQDGRAYIGALGGRFYALERDGTARWQYDTRPAKNPFASPRGSLGLSVTSPIAGAAVLALEDGLVIFGDEDGNVYALDRETGVERWVKEDMDGNLFSGLIGNSITIVDSTVYVGFSSVEAVGVAIGLISNYECCSFRGMIVALDVRSGQERWRYYTVPAAQALAIERLPYRLGPSGGAIWGPPTYDAETRTLFVGTGQNFSPMPDGHGSTGSDSILALDADTGQLKWSYQATQDDVWDVTRANPDAQGNYYDLDFGDSPKLYDLPGIGHVVGAGQKSGAYHILRASDGRLVSRTQLIQMGLELGGFQNLGGYADGVVYQHGVDRVGPAVKDAPYVGTVLALDPDGTHVRWRFDRPQSPFAGGIAIANDVVYVQSPVEEADGGAPEGAIYALHAETGAQLARLPSAGRAVASMVVSNGRVYVGGGNGAVPDIGLDNVGSLSCYGLPTE